MVRTRTHSPRPTYNVHPHGDKVEPKSAINRPTRAGRRRAAPRCRCMAPTCPQPAHTCRSRTWSAASKWQALGWVCTLASGRARAERGRLVGATPMGSDRACVQRRAARRTGTGLSTAISIDTLCASSTALRRCKSTACPRNADCCGHSTMRQKSSTGGESTCGRRARG